MCVCVIIMSGVDTSYYVSLVVCTVLIVSMAFILPRVQPLGDRGDSAEPRRREADVETEMGVRDEHDDPFEAEPTHRALDNQTFYDSKVRGARWCGTFLSS